MHRIIGIIFTLLLAIALPGAGFAANFGAGNIVVTRVGTGTGALSSAATAIFLDEYNATGSNQAAPVQSIALPTVASGNNRALTVAGSSGQDGSLRRSTDGRYLTLAGYNAAPGTLAIAGTPSAATNRVVARVDTSGTIDTSTLINNFFSAGNIRGAVTTDGTGFWTIGNKDGVQYVAYGATSSTQITTAAPTNLRVPGIFNGQLYVSSASGTFQGVGTVGSGLPTTGTQTLTLLSGFPTATGPGPNGFYMPNTTTVYVADDRAVANGGGIQKWTLSGSTWSLAYTLNSGLTSGIRGLTGTFDGTTVTLYATSADTLTKLVMVTDSGSTSAFTTLATAAANTAFRGVDIAPAPPVNGSCGADNGQTLAATAPTNYCATGTLSSFSGSGHPWTWSCLGQNGGSDVTTCSASIQTYTLSFTTDGNGTISGTTPQTVDYGASATPVTANNNVDFTFQNWNGTLYANPLTVTNVTASQTITANFSATPVAGVCGGDAGMTLAATAPTNLCATGAPSSVTGNGHSDNPWSWTCAGINGGNTPTCNANIQQYTLTFAADGNGTLTGTTTQIVDYGASADSVTATAKDTTYELKNWTGTNGFATTTANPLTITNVTASRAYTANFKGGFTIFHVNDTHARLTPHKWVVTEHNTNTTPVFENVGGAAYLAAKMQELTKSQPNSLVIDAGDISEGNPIGDMGGNGSMTQFYTLLSGKLKNVPGRNNRGLDAVVVGNHDVRDTTYINNLVSLQNSGVPVISANVRTKCLPGTDPNYDPTCISNVPYFAPYTIVTINGTRIGILGYTNQSAEVGASLSSTLDVVPCDWDGTTAGGCHIADYVNDLRNNQGCDVVVLAAHIGHSAIVDPAAPLLKDTVTAKLPEIAVTGHWHTYADTVWQPEMLGYKTIFTEAASYMKYIGELKVTDAGKYLGAVQHPIRNADITPDPDVQAFVDNLTVQYNAAHPGHPVNEVIGYTADNLMLDNSMKWWSANEYPWSGNNTAGQWICDAMQWKAAQLFGSCDLAMETGGGVRADIPKGAVTYLQIYETFPWNDDTFYRINMTGQEIVNFLKKTNMDAGFSSKLDVTANDGVATAASVKFDNQPIELTKTYTVAINNYMYAHPPTGWTWSDKAPLIGKDANNKEVLVRDGIVDFMRSQHGSPTSAYSVNGKRYHLNTEFSGGYRAVVTMMNDNDTKNTFEDAFIRFLSATPETLARRGSNQVPADLVNADGTINPANRLSEQELYRSYLGFKKDVLKPGDIIETWGKGSFYGGNPEFVDQEGIQSDGVEFKIVGHDDGLAKPAFMGSIGAFWDDWHKNHYVQFLAKKASANTVTDQYGQTISIMDVTGYKAMTLPGNVNDILMVSGIPTMESYGMRFRCDKAVVAPTGTTLPAVTTVTSSVNPVPAGTTASSITLSATTAIGNGVYNLAPIADAQVASGNAGTNYGTGTNLFIQSADTTKNSFGNERAWLKFDISAIPAGATVTGANLQMWAWKATGDDLTTEIRGVSDDTWSETGITWNSQPSSSFWSNPLDTVTLTAATTNLWYRWDVGSFIQQKRNANQNNVSLFIKAAAENSLDAVSPGYGFDAKEFGSNGPVLQVSTLTAGATISSVQFFYRYSSDGASWGSWIQASSPVTYAPYTNNFSFPNGSGYYEFYSLATDGNSNAETVPAAAQAATHYTSSPAYYPIISIDNVYQKYTNSPKAVTVTTIPAGATYNVTYNGSSTEPTAPGTYAVSVTANEGGNTVTTNGTLTIAKAGATVSLANLYYFYDGNAKSATVSTTPAGLNTTVTYNGFATAPSAAGKYRVAAIINDVDYQGGATGTLTIVGNISSQVGVKPGAMVYNRGTKLYNGSLTVTNTSQSAITGTVYAQLNNLTSGITLVNATGTYNGFPYVGITPAVPLNPGQSMSFPIQLNNPNGLRINYNTLVLN